MRLAGELRPAAFLKRLNRFSCLVGLGGGEEAVHLPNSGRLTDLLIPGRPVLLARGDSPGRRTRYDLVMAVLGHILVSVDARRPGDLVEEALAASTLPQFRGYPRMRREVAWGRGRLDFWLGRDDQQCLIEVKSITLVEQGCALFPDAPTLRGRRHLQSLIQAKDQGHRAAIIFVVQREDAQAFAPNDRVDPEFGHLLRQAQGRGVEVYAYRCKVSPGEIKLAAQIPVYISRDKVNGGRR